MKKNPVFGFRNAIIAQPKEGQTHLQTHLLKAETKTQ